MDRRTFATVLGALGASEAVMSAATGAARTFELRIYHAAPGKLDDLLARFRNHTTKLFEKHGMTNVGYWVPTDGEQAGKTLYYLLAYPSRDAAKASWDKFRNDQDWVKARTASEVNGKLVDKVDSIYLTATDFSQMK